MRWESHLQHQAIKGSWTNLEDQLIVRLVETLGVGRWASLARVFPGRSGKQCRERWANHLDPSIRKEAWSKREDDTLLQMHERFGNK